MTSENSSELKFLGEQCRVKIASENDKTAIANHFDGIPNLPKLRSDLDEQKNLVEKLGSPDFISITEIKWTGTALELFFSPVKGKQFTDLPKLSDESTSVALVQLAKSLEKLHELGAWSGWLDPKLLYMDEKTVSVVLALPKCLQSRNNQIDLSQPFVAPEFTDLSLSMDSRVDVYGLGAIGFFLLTGSPPPASDIEEVLAEHTKSEELRAIISKCLSRSPDDRYQILGEVIDALDSAELAEGELDDPSLVVLNTDEGGLSLSLKEGTTSIGSSVDSTLRLPKLPEIAAQIERKNGVTSIKILSDQTAKLNQQIIKTGQSRQLSRGAVLEIPPYKLRYLAPNEIYSRKAVVEIGGSETDSQRLYKKVGLMFMGLALFGLGFSMFRTQQSEVAKAAKELQTRLKNEKALAGFIWTGDFYLRTTDPKVTCSAVKCTNECKTAIECYSQALAIDPSDTYAQSRLEQAQKIVPEEAKTEIAQVDNSEEKKLVDKAKALIESGNLFCTEGECAETVVNKILTINSLSANGKELLIQIAAEAVDRSLKARAEGNYAQLETHYQIASRLGVDEQYIAPLKAGIDTIKRSTSSVVIIDENPKETDNDKKSISRIDTEDLVDKLSTEHGYVKPANSREVLDISSFDKR